LNFFRALHLKFLNALLDKDFFNRLFKRIHPLKFPWEPQSGFHRDPAYP
jgi:hypothetical protein